MKLVKNWYMFLPSLSLCLALLIMLIRGETPLWSQNNEQQSNSKKEQLQTWERLSEQFEMSLDMQEQTLNEALLRITTLEKSGETLNYLLKQSLEQNSRLKEFNQQIGQRMQERDEDLAKAYVNIDSLRKANRWMFIAVCFVVAGIALRVFLYIRGLR